MNTGRWDEFLAQVGKTRPAGLILMVLNGASSRKPKHREGATFQPKLSARAIRRGSGLWRRSKMAGRAGLRSQPGMAGGYGRRGKTHGSLEADIIIANA